MGRSLPCRVFCVIELPAWVLTLHISTLHCFGTSAPPLLPPPLQPLLSFYSYSFFFFFTNGELLPKASLLISQSCHNAPQSRWTSAERRRSRRGVLGQHKTRCTTLKLETYRELYIFTIQDLQNCHLTVAKSELKLFKACYTAQQDSKQYSIRLPTPHVSLHCTTA